VDWEGSSDFSDFSNPHIYCHFDFDRQPYEEVVLYREYSGGLDADGRLNPLQAPRLPGVEPLVVAPQDQEARTSGRAEWSEWIAGR
jgi:hypothetical protein